MKLIYYIIGIIIILVLFYSIIPTIIIKLKNCREFKCTKNKKAVALTFDDGPSSNYTPELLDLLKKYNIKATFFIVAKFAEENHEIIDRMINEGHLIGLHSLEHKNALIKGYKYTNNDFRESMEILKKYGWNVNYYRPPWGHINLVTLKNIKKYKLKLILWSVMAEDWSGNITSKEIEKRILKRTKCGSVICLHDGRGKNKAPSRTIKALEKVLPTLIDEGYEFLSIGEVYGKQL